MVIVHGDGRDGVDGGGNGDGDGGGDGGAEYFDK